MAAQNGTLLFDAGSLGRLSVDLYLPDAAGGLATFNSSGAAASTSPSTWIAPVDCVLIDMTATASPTATAISLNRNGATINGGVLRFAQQLAANPNRPAHRIGFKKGDQLGGLNLA